MHAEGSRNGSRRIDYALVLSLWMYSNDDGLAATLYSPCEVHARVGDTAVHLSEVTDYPFRGDIRVTVTPETPISFPLRLRIPAWADEPVLLVNKQRVAGAPQAGFAKIDRAWKKGDVVELRLPMTPRVLRGYNESGSIERGPVVFSFPIGESWVKLRDRGMTADWQVFPSSQWKNALAVSGENAHTISVDESFGGGSPFSLAEAPVRLR